jgi:hypothetical protein
MKSESGRSHFCRGEAYHQGHRNYRVDNFSVKSEDISANASPLSARVL